MLLNLQPKICECEIAACNCILLKCNCRLMIKSSIFFIYSTTVITVIITFYPQFIILKMPWEQLNFEMEIKKRI